MATVLLMAIATLEKKEAMVSEANMVLPPLSVVEWHS